MNCTLPTGLLVLAMAISGHAYDHKILMVSDYQNNGAPIYQTNFQSVTTYLKNNSISIERAVLGGDYVDGSVYEDGSNTSLSDMESRFGQITSVLQDRWPHVSWLAIQGNHDAATWVTGARTSKLLDATGAYEYEDYIIYLINEDDFPWWQAGYSSYSSESTCLAAINAASSALQTYLNGLIASDEPRPVLIATHVPLHWSGRTTTALSWWSDNIHADILFNVINKAAEDLDIVMYAGHNHSEDLEDPYLNSGVIYFDKGDSIRIPNGKAAAGGNYTIETLAFTYLNMGYIGEIDIANEKVNSVTVTSISDSLITIDRYSINRLYRSHAVARTQHDDVAIRAVKDAGTSRSGAAGFRVTGNREQFTVTLSSPVSCYTLRVLDVHGREVACFAGRGLCAGRHLVRTGTGLLPPGGYIVGLATDKGRYTAVVVR
ncbi:MAG: metallophosphoesterase [Chitinispirillaceae bacterium]|nr:metallophosphoesterase [Chitinispirillaceae bacterium]